MDGFGKRMGVLGLAVLAMGGVGANLCVSCTSPKPPDLRHGNPAASDRAVSWLAKQQHSDGHWGSNRHRVSLTCLATLALFSRGETPSSTEYGRTVPDALRAVLRDAEADADRPQEESALLTWCLAEAYAQTRVPALREPLRMQARKLDVRQASPWHALAAKALFRSGAAPEMDRELLAGIRANFPVNTNSLANQASHLYLALQFGDRQNAARPLDAVRRLLPERWKEDDRPLQAAVMLSTSLLQGASRDWDPWYRAFRSDVDQRQVTRATCGWWTAGSFGICAESVPGLSGPDGAVYTTSLILLAFPPFGSRLPSYYGEPLLPGTGERDDSIVVEVL